MFFFHKKPVPYQRKSIEEGLQDKAEKLILDVRSKEEYANGHLPGSKNLPLSSIRDIKELTRNKKLALYVYCRSGARSRRACKALCAYGFEDVKDIGGIMRYKGKLDT